MRERAHALPTSGAACTGIEPFAGPFRKLTEEQKQVVTEQVMVRLGNGSAATIRIFLRRAGSAWDARGLAALYMHAGTVAGEEGAADLQRWLLEEAVEIGRSTATLRALIRHYNGRGLVAEAARLGDELEALEGPTASPGTIKLLRNVREKREFWIESGAFFDSLARFRRPAWRPHSRKMLYVLHNTLPYASAGYATRAQGILRGVRTAGYEVLGISRPGFPMDVPPYPSADLVPPEDTIEGVPYRRVFGTTRNGRSDRDYIEKAADCLELEFAREQPAVVQAASNYLTGAAAMVATRRLGIPFIYEVRGFWEITRASREPDFRDSEQYAALERLEAQVARAADIVITLTSAMKGELIRRGVPGERIELVHNAVDPDRFRPAPRNQELAAKLGLPEGVPVIGYIGSHVEYEGLDLLVEASARLRLSGIDFRLLLVGDGSVTEDVLSLAAGRGLQDILVFTGRVPHEEVEDYYSLIDVCPFPRKPWPVCELVSPMKPFEALAMSKAVVVADTHALSEIIEHDRTGLQFRKGDVDDLAEKLALCVRDAGMRRRLGAAGRRWVLEHRTWDGAGRKIVGLFEQVITNRAAAGDTGLRRCA